MEDTSFPHVKGSGRKDRVAETPWREIVAKMHPNRREAVLAKQISRDPMDRIQSRYKFGIWLVMRNNGAGCCKGKVEDVFRGREIRSLESQRRWNKEFMLYRTWSIMENHQWQVDSGWIRDSDWPRVNTAIDVRRNMNIAIKDNDRSLRSLQNSNWRTSQKTGMCGKIDSLKWGGQWSVDTGVALKWREEGEYHKALAAVQESERAAPVTENVNWNEMDSDPNYKRNLIIESVSLMTDDDKYVSLFKQYVRSVNIDWRTSVMRSRIKKRFGIFVNHVESVSVVWLGHPFSDPVEGKN